MNKNFLQPSHKLFGQNMQRISLQMEEANTEEKAKLLGLPYLNFHSFPVDLNVMSMLPESEAREFQAIPFSHDQNQLRIAAVEPKDPKLLARMAQMAPKYKINYYVVSKSGLDYALTFYRHVVSPKERMSEQAKAKPEADFPGMVEQLKSVDFQKQQNITELVGDLFGIAMHYKASDIHIEPEQRQLKVRFRVDGVLQDMIHLDLSLKDPLVSRIKILSQLKLNVQNLPQDGRLTFLWGSDPVDVRVSSLPSAYGEGVVMRLLGVGAVRLKVGDLGLTGRSYEIIESELEKPHGMIITTGPTGSGKTTTLYAFLNEMNKPGVKVITIEDPVEYKLEGIQQTPIDHNVDFSFAKALRAILRQDPDVVMVGEIRDDETADTALQASLTGHMVFSTLHTNDSFGAIPRLLSMGAKSYIIASALSAVIAQRLVRRLCEVCKVSATVDAALLARAESILKDISPKAGVEVPNPLKFYHSPGCKECGGLGYKGRIGIYEVIQVNDQLKELIIKEASMMDMKHQAIADGTLTMAQDGLLKALNGITDVEEVFRVAGE